ncbi:hypothetical protein NP233_g11194 [Leucocoprinus birnbaumii]|uniref:Protein kinase domain-containing protein n=1 Tax=Leucocoprinus birnbaumii TaxID=56174 RepID=A0AAD5VJ07_9AGAR|nr:hypothetical protein NP233_g11194 [Leucocoprinus birnbaumii]
MPSRASGSQENDPTLLPSPASFARYSGPPTPVIDPYTPLTGIASQSFTQQFAGIDMSIPELRQSEREMPTDMHIQQDLSYIWNSNSIFPSDSEILLGSNFDLNAIPAIELGNGKFNDQFVEPSSTLQFGQDFVHAFQGRKYPQDTIPPGINGQSSSQQLAGTGISVPHSSEINKRVRALVTELQGDKSVKKELIYALRGVNAQCMVDLLNTAHAGELALWAHISHRNILPLYGVYLSDEAVERICIVSPWMEYGDLLQYLKAFPESPRIPLILDIIHGLRYLHSVDIIHGDLKASNVLISSEKHAMLADFGVSHIMMTMGTTTTRGFTGTANWTAPELLLEEEEETEPMATKESDIWSFACTCYEALTGQMPFFHIKKVVHLIRALMRGVRPLRGPLPAECDAVKENLWTLMEKCWNYDPNERPDAEGIEQMISELFQFNYHSSFDSTLLPAPSEIAKSTTKIDIDYDRVLEILRWIEEASVGFERGSKEPSVVLDVMQY